VKVESRRAKNEALFDVNRISNRERGRSSDRPRVQEKVLPFANKGSIDLIYSAN
jgi:hypothetical protein